MELDPKVKELLVRLRNEMNGAASAEMTARGLVYGLNYGVSAPTIKKIADEYFPDHDLAEKLFGSDVRELKLAAVWIDDPQRVDTAQMRRWAAAFSNEEVADRVVMGLFYAAPGAGTVALEWLGADDPALVAAGLRLAGRMAVAGRELPDGIPAAIETVSDFTDRRVCTAAIYALTKITCTLAIIRKKPGGEAVAAEVEALQG